MIIMTKKVSSVSFSMHLLAVSAMFLACSGLNRIETLHAFSFFITSSSSRSQSPTTRTIFSSQWSKNNNNNNKMVVIRAAASADLEDYSSSLQHQQLLQQQQHLSPIRHISTSACTTTATAAVAAAATTTTIETTSSTSTSASSSAVAVAPATMQQHSLSAWETWCVQNMQDMYRQALGLKCPFFRRRASDLLDALDQVFRFLVIVRHKSLPSLVQGPPVPSTWRHLDDDSDDMVISSSKNKNIKLMHLSMDERLDIIRRDWRVDNNCGYYITARFNTSLYRDDCVFDGPDPDMPVRGLHKYINAASQLFDIKSSRAQLLNLEIVKQQQQDKKDLNKTTFVIVAHWRIQGTLRLPWKPKLPTWTGTTTYHFDNDDDTGLINKHVETWDISVIQAFVQTLAPNLARFIWKDDNKEEEISSSSSSLRAF